MPWISFVRSKIDGTFHKNRQICVDLNQTFIVPLIPIVTAPRFVVHIFQPKGFILRQDDILLCTQAAFINCGLKY